LKEAGFPWGWGEKEIRGTDPKAWAWKKLRGRKRRKRRGDQFAIWKERIELTLAKKRGKRRHYSGSQLVKGGVGEVKRSGRHS